VPPSTSKRAIVVTNDARSEHWGLGPLPPREGAFSLIGWTFEAADGGVPGDVAHTLARALVRCGRVTFPCSSVPEVPIGAWHEHDGDQVRRLGSPNRPSKLPLLSTIRGDRILLFDDPSYPWWFQGSFALLSRPAAALPDFSGLPDVLFEAEWADALRSLKEAGVDSIIRPGVDGDVVGLVCSSVEVRSEILEAIELASAEFELGFSVLSEEDFAAALLSRPDAS
jgi:hypothetical protein